MWRQSVSVEVQQRGDRFLFTFNNQRDLDRVKKGGPWSYQRAMILLNDYDSFSDIMAAGLRRGSTRVRVTLPLNSSVRKDRRLRVSPENVIRVQDRANTQAVLVVPNFLALFREKRPVQLREVPLFPPPAKVTSVIHIREEDETEGGKRMKHSLAMVPMDLSLEDHGFSMAVSGELGIKKTGKSSRKRGRPRGKDKKQLFIGESSSSMADSVIHEPLSNEETGGE
ncbi:hypothetical protein ACLB2K_030118 [Fragaria x ananassa]